MNIFISDLTTVCNTDDMICNLSPNDLVRYKSFVCPKRAKQFLVAHSIKNKIARNFRYISIAHKDDFVIVAASNSPIGVDIENMTRKRDFGTISKFMNFQNINNADDFYRAFTLYEAQYKSANNTELTPYFYRLKNYMICIVSNDTEIKWENPELIPEQI